MREIFFEELKLLEMDIFLAIDKYCREKSLRYYMAYGTLIGAVRHKGFIPWDDDIDIWMPRSDYMRFMQEFNHDYYKAYCAEFDPHWPHYIAKVCDERTVIDEGHGDKCGVYVDIFPLDGWPDSPAGIKKHFDRVSNLMRLWSNQHYTKYYSLSECPTIAKKCKAIIGRFLGLFTDDMFYLRKILAERERYDFCKSQFIGTICAPCIETFPNNIESIELEFEGTKFLAPKDYDVWLRTIYGDYMQLPPEEQRVSNHGFQAFWK